MTQTSGRCHRGRTILICLTITSTKGGVGKTTLAANLGALFADMGFRVLMVDADVQPSLSKYYPLTAPKPIAGLTELVVRGEMAPECITATIYRNLDIVISDDPEAHLPQWLMARIDRGFAFAWRCDLLLVADAYDFVVVDTQGAVGPLQDAAVMAADLLVSPITPEILSAREFRDGTVELLQRLGSASALGVPLAPMKAVINRQDRTADARLIVGGIREEFVRLNRQVSVLDTVVPMPRRTRRRLRFECRCIGMNLGAVARCPARTA